MYLNVHSFDFIALPFGKMEAIEVAAISSSSVGVPPLIPTAPITFPFQKIGRPPPTTLKVLLFDNSIERFPGVPRIEVGFMWPEEVIALLRAIETEVNFAPSIR